LPNTEMGPMKILLCGLGGGGENDSSVELTRGPAVLKLRTLLPQVGTEAAQRKYLTPGPLITVIS
jgi:hypothetical protein